MSAPAATRTGLSRLAIVITAAAILGALEITFAVAYAVLLFSDQLAPFLGQGIGLILVGTILSIVTISLFSSYKGSIGSGQDLPTIMMGVMFVTVLSGYGAGEATPETFGTLVALMSIGAFMTAALMLGLGLTRLGRIIRFVPFPVIGGLLAGTGWMLALVSLNMMTDLEIGLETVAVLFQSEYLWRWIPGVVIAAILYLVDSRFDSPFSIPLVLLVSFVAFHIALSFAGISQSEAVANGTLLSLSSDKLTLSFSFASLTGGVDWSVIWQQLPLLLSLCVLATIMSLVQVSSIEVIVNQEMDMNRELVTNGFANTLIGLFGGVVAYHHISDTTLAHRLQVRSRFVGIASALFCVLPFTVGSDWLNWFPVPVLAGLILYLGIGFLDTWLVRAARRLPLWEYLIVVLIFLTIVNVNFPVAVLVGIFCGVALFLVRYSRTSVASGFLTGSDCRSVVKRSHPEEMFLADQHDKIALLRLKGFLFFGTAGSLYERIEGYLTHENPALEALAIDFREVPSIDFTAVMGLSRIRRLLDQRGVRLVVSAVPEADASMVLDALIPTTADREASAFQTRDLAIEALEQHLLVSLGELESIDNHLANNLARENWSQADVDQVASYFERRDLADGEYLITAGDTETDVFIVEDGYLEVSQKRGNRSIRLRVFAPSSVIGEMSVYTGMARSADVIARGTAAVHALTEQRLHDMERDNPALAIRLHRYFASNLASKIMDDVAFAGLRDTGSE